MNTVTMALYLTVWLTLTYLIYRYARYSPWRELPAGRAFMWMKAAFWLLVTYALVYAIIPDQGTFRDQARIVVVLLIESALLTQVHLIVQLQGGFRRRRPLSKNDEMHEAKRQRRIRELADLRRLRKLARTEKRH